MCLASPATDVAVDMQAPDAIYAALGRTRRTTGTGQQAGLILTVYTQGLSSRATKHMCTDCSGNALLLCLRSTSIFQVNLSWPCYKLIYLVNISAEHSRAGMLHAACSSCAKKCFPQLIRCPSAMQIPFLAEGQSQISGMRGV